MIKLIKKSMIVIISSISLVVTAVLILPLIFYFSRRYLLDVGNLSLILWEPQKIFSSIVFLSNGN